MQISPHPIGSQIAKRRKAQDLTQRQLAALVSRSPGVIARIETGLRSPSSVLLAALAQALRTTLETLVAGTDWNGSNLRQGVGGARVRRLVRRAFRIAAGTFRLHRAAVKKRRAFYVTFSETARRLGGLLRSRRNLNWRAVLRLDVTTAGEAGFVVHTLGLDSQVERWSPLDVGLRLLITDSAASPPVFAGDQRRWCIRARQGDMALIVFLQVPFVGLSGEGYRADFIVGALRNGRVVWLDIEIDEPYHEQQKDKDAERDEDVPIETIRIPEARLISDTFLTDLLETVRHRLDFIRDPAPHPPVASSPPPVASPPPVLPPNRTGSASPPLPWKRAPTL